MRRKFDAALLLAAVFSGCSGQEPPAPAVDTAPGQVFLFEESCCENDVSCQDGNWCNGIETCDCWGECGPGEPPCLHTPDPTDPCLAYGACINDRIDPAGTGYGMGHCEITVICDACTVVGDCPAAPDACSSVACVAGYCQYPAIDCTDADLCTADSCNPATGCINTPILCTDPDPCLVGACDPATGACVFTDTCCHADGDCPDDGNVCTDEHCNMGTGACYTTNNTAPCSDDGEVCTQDICSGGLCTHDPWADPSAHACGSDGEVCTQDICQADGTCGHLAWPSPETHACPSDGNVCSNDVCQADGTCGHLAWPSPETHACASDLNACTQDFCQADTTCGHIPWPDGSLPLGCCNDDVDCDDSNACTVDTCLATWVCQVPADTASLDGTACAYSSADPCVLGGQCSSGLCLPLYNDPANETCASPEALAFGAVPAGGYGFDVGDSAQGDTTCADDDYSAFDETDAWDIFYGCGTDAAPELVYQFDFNVGGDYEMYQYVVDAYRYSGPRSDPHTDEFVYARSTCSDGNTQIACNDDCNYPTWSPLSGYCTAQLPSALSASVVIPPAPMGTANTVSVFADGYGNNTGEFEVRARRRIHDNNGCTNWSNLRTEPLITGESVWRGNTAGYTNYHMACVDLDANGVCDDPPGMWWAGPDCVMPVNASCSVQWINPPGGWAYVCNANDPFEAGWVARFATAGSYHIYVDERAHAGSFNTALALWGPNEGSEDCGFGNWYGCTFGSGQQPASLRVDVGAADVGDVYMIEISNVDANQRGNYELNVVYQNPQYRGLHELFTGATATDLNNYRIDFTPDGSADRGYSYSVTGPSAVWPIDPWSAGSGSVFLDNENAADVSLPFYQLLGDVFYRNVRFYANGHIRFYNGAQAGGGDSTPTVDEHYQTYEPQVAPFWADLYNVTVRYGSGLFEGQSVYWLAWTNNSAVNGFSSRYVRFQVIFHIDGKITFYYRTIGTVPAGRSVLVGNSGTANVNGVAVNYR